MDRLWNLLFPLSGDPLEQRIGALGSLMAGTTLAMLLTGTALETAARWREASVPTLTLTAVLGLIVAVALSALALLPYVLGHRASRRTGRPRLLFSTCLVLFFVGFALRAFLFFDHVQVRLQGHAEGLGAVFIGEPLASTLVVALLWGRLRWRA